MRNTRRTLVTLAVLTAVLAASTPAWAASWHLQTAVQPESDQVFQAVTTTSSSDAWAVGYYGPTDASTTLIEHRNSSGWTQVASPSPGSTENVLDGVKATSATNVWAVGYYGTNGIVHPLVEHYDGVNWSVASIPDYPDARFTAVGAGSSTNVWAVGYVFGSSTYQPISEHYDGTGWSIVAVPGETGDTYLNGVTTLSSSDAWAAGYTTDGVGHTFTLIEHYDGMNWTTVPTPDPSPISNHLSSISATTDSDIWSVGFYYNRTPGTDRSLILHFDGTTWHQVGHPRQGRLDSLASVKAVSATDVWAVGYYVPASGPEGSWILHYDGTSWGIESSPNRGKSYNYLYGVASSSSKNAFAVGQYTVNGLPRALVMHCTC